MPLLSMKCLQVLWAKWDVQGDARWKDGKVKDYNKNDNNLNNKIVSQSPK